MSESLQTLKGKYQLSLASVRELQHENELKDEKIARIQEEHIQLEKSVKTLCETILKKGREKEGEQAWFKLSLSKMIVLAQTSIEEYFPSVTGSINKLIASNSGYVEKIIQLQEELKQKNEEIKRLTLIQKAAAKSTDPATPEESKPAPVPKISIEEEQGDGIAAFVGESIDAYADGGMVMEFPQNIPIKNSKATKDKSKKFVQRAAANKADKIQELAESLTIQQKIAIEILGKTGLSLVPQMKEYMKKAMPDSRECRVTAGLNTSCIETGPDSKKYDTGNYLFEKKCANVPGNNKLNVYRLTQIGSDVYKYLFKEDPVESEMTIILKNHSSIEHGFGIVNVAKEIINSKYIGNMNADVQYLTRGKEFSVKTGENTSYIPDIVIKYKGKNGRDILEYIEYETGKGNTKEDFMKKCNKIASFTNIIYIIIPSEEIKTTVLDKINYWKDAVMKSNEWPGQGSSIEVKLLTYYGLKSQSDVKHFRDIKWDTITVNKRRERK